MKLESFTYTQKDGWSVEHFPPLDSTNSVVFAFGAPEIREDPSPLKELLAAYPKARKMSCSTAGEISGERLMDQSISVAVAKFERSQLDCTTHQVTENSDSHEVGIKIAQDLLKADLKAIFVLSNGLLVSGSELVRGMNEVLPDGVLVTGGMSGDGDRFKHTWVVDGNQLGESSVSAVGFYGENIHVGHGSKGGWDVFGPQRKVTRAKDNVLYELDGKPALNLYKEYLGELAAELPSSGLLFPLSLRENPNDKRNIVRTILGVDEKENSLIFAGDIPQGHYAQLMKANFDRLVNGAAEAAHMADLESENVETLTIAISCVGRRLVLGERTEEELEAVHAGLSNTAHQIGFYSYGEISPYNAGKCDLHNQTMTLTTIQEQ